MKDSKKCKWCNKQIKLGDEFREVDSGGLMHEHCIKFNGFEIISLSNYAKILGKKGGEVTLKKYGKDKMTEWGKKGGRPKTSK